MRFVLSTVKLCPWQIGHPQFCQASNFPPLLTKADPGGNPLNICDVHRMMFTGVKQLCGFVVVIAKLLMFVMMFIYDFGIVHDLMWHIVHYNNKHITITCLLCLYMFIATLS